MKEQEETVEVTIHNNPNGLYSETTVQYGSSGDIYAIELSRSAHEQLKEYFLNEETSKRRVKCTACSGSKYYCGKPCGACNGTGLED